MNVHDHSALADAWRAEINNCEIDRDCFDAADCVELADELDLYRIQALSDPNFDASFGEWASFICDNQLWLALEQCCNDGVLLPMDSRTLRVQTCPREMLRALSRFFEHCPVHVKHHLAQYFFLIVRMDRARRTGSPEWRPTPPITP